MTVVNKYTCDRCGAVRETRAGVVVLPDTWKAVILSQGKECHLCAKCLNDLDHFARGARIEHVAVENSDQLESLLRDLLPLVRDSRKDLWERGHRLLGHGECS